MISNNVNDTGIKVNGGNVDKIEFITNVFVGTDADFKEASDWEERLMAALQKSYQLPIFHTELIPGSNFITSKFSFFELKKHSNYEG
ncbi:hypothetical protein [[Flexibacter] sp. ATCC 35208]|uniref:hypothetical protein n=1 Tax=[Flexibacter] sp. ATCC 35208 TaxID=1936242 RepID=UPI0009C4FA7F|nr:hypothetical protein [[Flexibacter] sp. ATCC 35208]OMP75082.1 hypothetical protein BW716_31935 [[Flexibacter] sp. ATCC 35208]